MNRVAEVNKWLRETGKTERLVKGRGYYYFTGGDASTWPSSGVYVHRASDLTLECWQNEYRTLSGGE